VWSQPRPEGEAFAAPAHPCAQGSAQATVAHRSESLQQ
jgi:hypothetical protein